LRERGRWFAVEFMVAVSPPGSVRDLRRAEIQPLETSVKVIG
jgi:hypothetical protein